MEHIKENAKYGHDLNPSSGNLITNHTDLGKHFIVFCKDSIMFCINVINNNQSYSSSAKKWESLTLVGPDYSDRSTVKNPTLQGNANSCKPSPQRMSIIKWVWCRTIVWVAQTAGRSCRCEVQLVPSWGTNPCTAPVCLQSGLPVVKPVG